MDWRDGYTCTCCGEWREGVPLAYRTAAPQYWSDEFDGRDNCELTPDLRIVDAEHFFIHGNINIPIIGTDQNFQWGVWGSLSAESFRHTLAVEQRDGITVERVREIAGRMHAQATGRA